MARPGGKTAGRVSVRVIPDATKFRNDLKLLLKRVDQSMSANLMVTADTRSAESSIRRFQKDWEGKQVQLAAGMSTAAARAQLRLLQRPRVVPLVVRVSQASVKRAATIIASLSGIRVAGDWVRNLSERLQNLDRALPKIAVVSQSIAGLSALLLSAVGGTFTLGAGLTQILGVSAALPGIITGMAVGATVLALALSDTGKRLLDLKPDFVELKEIVSDNYWAVAETPIRNFIGSVLPGLRSGLGLTATAVGLWSASIVESFQSALGGGVIDVLFANLVESINIASTGTGGFAQALVTLGAVGGTYLPRLAQWAADLSNQFNAFITRVEGDGSLVRFIENGITAAGHLFDALGSIGSILSGIANAAGEGGLRTFAAILERVADVVNSPGFQTTLSTLFSGAEAGAAGLATALAPIGAMLAVLAPTISTILRTSGEVVGKLLGDIAKSASSPIFQKGLAGFFDGIQRGLLAISPVLPAIADAFGTFLGFAGTFAEALGPVLGSVLAGLAPILTNILTALQPMLPLLGDAMVAALQAVAPELLTLVQAVLPLLPSLIDFLIQALPLFVALIGIVAEVAPLLLTLVHAFTDLLEIQGAFFGFLGGLITLFTEGGVSIANYMDLVYGLPGPLGELVRGIGRFSLGIVNGVIDALNGIRGAVTDFVNWVAKAMNIGVQISVNKIPRLYIPQLDTGSYASMATGGDVLARPGGTFARLAEAGRDERVIDRGLGNRNLDLSNRMAQRLLAMSSGPSGPVNITVVAAPDDDPRLTGRIVGRELDDLMAGR